MKASDIIAFGALLLSGLSYMKAERKSVFWLLLIVGLAAFVVSIFSRTNPKHRASTQSGENNVQQSIGNVSGSSTVNQAAGNITINQGIPEETIRQLINQKAVSSQAQLSFRYPKGYVILGMANGKIIFYSDNAPKNLEVDWKATDIKIEGDKKHVWVHLPDIYIINSSISLRDNNVGFAYHNGAVQHLATIYEDTLDAEVLDADYGIIVVGIK